MSDNELEIVFENVQSTETRKKQNSRGSSVLSPDCSVAKVPKISVEEAQKIKSETSEYLKQQIGKLKTKYNSESRPLRQLEIDHPRMKLKSLKNTQRNEISQGKHSIFSMNISKDSFTPIILNNDQQEVIISCATSSNTCPVNSSHQVNDNNLTCSSVEIIADKSGELSDSLVLPQYLKKNGEFSISPIKSPTKNGQLNDKEKFISSETSHSSQKNDIIVSSDSSTNISAGSKDSKTSSPVCLQWDQKKSIVQSASSTSDLNEGGEVESGTHSSQKNDIIPQHLQKNGEFSISPIKSPTKNEQLNDSKEKCISSETPHISQKNEIVVSSDSSTNKSGGSKDYKTSAPECLQWDQKKSIVQSASSTSDLNEQIKVESGASPSKAKVKFSYQLSKRPNKFSMNGSPVNSPKNRNIFSSGKKSPKSEQQTPPLSFMRNKFPGTHLSDARGVKRKLNFSNSSSEVSSSEGNEVLLNRNPLGDETESVTSSTQGYLHYADAYLLRQMKLHIDLVLEDSHSRDLLNDEERNVIQVFFDMNSECQDLYSRMHNRKYKWNRLSDIGYESATEENLYILEEKGFVVTDIKQVSFVDVLDLLKVPELKDLCKSLGIKSVHNKKSFSQELINYCQTQKTLGFQQQAVSSEEVVIRRIEKILGPCFILSPEPRGLFRRIHLLFNLKFNRNEQARYGSQDLFEIQFVGTEKALYPKSSIDKNAKVFTSREDLLRFQIAEDLKTDFLSAVDTKNFIKAEELLNTIRMNFISEFDFVSELDDSPRNSSYNLPLSLRRYTPGTVYAYTLSEGVDVLKKLKKREKAIDDLLLLLDQTTFLPYMRGRWYEKLIILHRTAGQHKEVAKTIRAGMIDPHVDDQGSYVMSCRCRELTKKKFKGVDREIKSMLTDVPLFPELEFAEITEIRACALEGKSGYKRVYIQEDEAGGGKTFSSVEELVKNHYCPRTFKHGIHAENSLVASLFGILFWDIIYEHHVPCAFISPYQTRPLDLSTGEFYKNRQEAIDTKLAKMLNWTDEDVSSWVTDVYSNHYGKSSVVHWKWFRNAADILSIINCIGLRVVSQVCERYAKKYRGVRSGFPDLFLWSPGEKEQYRFVEVKGPNDTLSSNQKLWLDFLVKINANVEVCSVIAQGSRTLKAVNALETNSTVGGSKIHETSVEINDENKKQCSIADQ